MIAWDRCTECNLVLRANDEKLVDTTNPTCKTTGGDHHVVAEEFTLEITEEGRRAATRAGAR